MWTFIYIIWNVKSTITNRYLELIKCAIGTSILYIIFIIICAVLLFKYNNDEKVVS